MGRGEGARDYRPSGRPGGGGEQKRSSVECPRRRIRKNAALIRSERSERWKFPLSTRTAGMIGRVGREGNEKSRYAVRAMASAVDAAAAVVIVYTCIRKNNYNKIKIFRSPLRYVAPRLPFYIVYKRHSVVSFSAVTQCTRPFRRETDTYKSVTLWKSRKKAFYERFKIVFESCKKKPPLIARSDADYI